MDLDQAEKDTFIDEVGERLQQFADSLLDFEKDPGNRNALNQLFRVAHTIKGNAGFVGLDNMVGTAHAAESLFARLRDGKIAFDPGMAQLFFECSDLLKQILDAFAADEDSSALDAGPLIARINAYMAAPVQAATPPEPETPAGSLFDIKIQLKGETALPGMRAYLIRSKLAKAAEIIAETPDADGYDAEDFDGRFTFQVRTEKSLDDIKKAVRNHEIASLEIEPAAPAAPTESSTPADETNDAGEPSAEGEGDVLFVTDDQDDLRASGPNKAAGRGDAGDILRVSTRKVDDILNLVGELLSANSAYLALAAEFREQFGNKGLYGYFRDNSEELARVGAELQEKVMKVRMIPIGTIFSRFRRIVRDYNAAVPAKLVELELRGEATEIDKYQIEGIHDPLMHLVRNSMDHGIESREDRTRAGKNPAGLIIMDSYQSGNNIFIEVRDDGGGLNLDRIRAKALENGLAGADDIAAMSPGQLMDFIFMPGFSTSQAVSEISGRGMGMDIVRKNIEAMSGSIEVSSETGRGTIFLIRLPLSMAIVTALKVTVGGHLFAVPIGVILETIKITEEDISIIDQVETIVVRELHVSLLRLGREMGVREPDAPASNGRKPKKKPVVIVQYGERRIGLMVDDLLGYEDMVIKSLARNYEDVEGLAGASILGKGEICLILDVEKLVNAILGKHAGTHSSSRFAVAAAAMEAKAESTPVAAKTVSPAAEPAPAQSPAPAPSVPEPTSTSAPASTTASASTTESAASAPSGDAGSARKLNPDEIAVLKKIISTGRKSALNACAN